MNTPTRSAVITAFAAVYIIWGSTYLGIKWAIDSIPPLLMVSARFLSAGILLYVWARMRGVPRPSLQTWGRAALVGLCLLVFGNGGLTYGEQYVPTGLASLLIALVPLYMALLGWCTGQTARPTPRIWLGLACGLAGVALLARPDTSVAMHPRFFLGVAITLLSGFVWSIGSLYSRKAGQGIDPTLMAGMQMLSAGAMLFPASLLHGELAHFSINQVTSKSFFSFIYLVLIGAIVGYSAYLWLLRHCPPAQVATYAYVNPIVAILLGVGLNGEKFTSSMLLGAIMIVAAVALVISRRTPSPGAAVPARNSALPATRQA